MAEQKDNYAVGIDLGTTFSCVGVMRAGKVEIIANDQGKRTTPSYVAFAGDDRLIGDAAKNQAAMNPQNTIFDAKRLIGRKFADQTVQRDAKLWPFTITPSEQGDPLIEVMYKGEPKKFPPEQISAMVLGKMKETAEDYLGSVVKDAVITVPAYFNDSQRQSTKDAGVIAGLNVLRIINEPTAAALAYGLQDIKSDVEKKVLIFDLGGGTFDVSILEICEGSFVVKSTAGDTHLGGEDFDSRIVDHCVKQFSTKHKKDLTTSDRALRRLRTACERAKCTLSAVTSAIIDIDALFEGIDFTCTLTRAKFEDLCADLFKKTMEPVTEALKVAQLAKAQIDEVVLVGGSTRIPKVQTLLMDFFGGKQLCKSINPDEAVAFGAAVQAAILTAKEENRGVCEDILLSDVISISVGLEVQGRYLEKIVDRATIIPCKKTKTFTTATDNQRQVKIACFQGERQETKFCKKLGDFDIMDLLPARRGVPQIEVSFDIDANGILKIHAEEKSSGKKGQLTISASDTNGLSKEEIDRMVNESKEFEEADRLLREKIEARNKLEQYCYDVGKTIEDEKAKFADDDYSVLKESVDKCKQFLEGGEATATVEEYRVRYEEFEKEVMPLMTKFYEANPGASGGGANMEEMMKDPKMRAQYEEMMRNQDPDQNPKQKGGPRVEEVD